MTKKKIKQDFFNQAQDIAIKWSTGKKVTCLHKEPNLVTLIAKAIQSTAEKAEKRGYEKGIMDYHFSVLERRYKIPTVGDGERGR